MMPIRYECDFCDRVADIRIEVTRSTTAGTSVGSETLLMCHEHKRKFDGWRESLNAARDPGATKP
jgi:hypothetical protein